MSTQYKITNAEKIIIEGQEVIDISVEFSCEGRDTLERRLNYPLTTTPEEIKEKLQQYCSTLDSDFEIGEVSKKLREDNEKADETISSLLGKKEE